MYIALLFLVMLIIFALLTFHIPVVVSFIYFIMYSLAYCLVISDYFIVKLKDKWNIVVYCFLVTMVASSIGVIIGTSLR